jgi:hypothetical protein
MWNFTLTYIRVACPWSDIKKWGSRAVGTYLAMPNGGLGWPAADREVSLAVVPHRLRCAARVLRATARRTVRMDTPSRLAHSALGLKRAASNPFSLASPFLFRFAGRPPCLPHFRIWALLWAFALATRPCGPSRQRSSAFRPMRPRSSWT